MSKTFTFFGFIFLWAVNSFAQQESIERLEILLKNAETDSSKVDILSDLADKYLGYQPRMVEKYATQALELSEKIGYPKGEIIALNRLGDNEFRLGNYARAVDLISQSLQLATSQQDSVLMAADYKILGNINNVGLKRYDTALSYQLKAFKILKQLGNTEQLASICGSITWIYATTNKNLAEAHRLADLGIHLSDSLNQPRFLSYNYNSKALIYQQEGKLDSAIRYIDLSNATAEKTNDNIIIAFNKRIKASIYLLKGNNNQAIDLFHEALTESKQLKIKEVIKNCYQGLAVGYANLGNYPLAYQYSRLYDQIKDSLINVEITQKALITELEFEEKKREAKIAELELANIQANNEKIIFGLVFGIVLVSMVTVVILITRNNRQRTKTNLLLKEKNQKIAEQNLKLTEVNETKDKLFSIISHDLRGPLSSLKGMLGLLVRGEISTDEFNTYSSKLHKQVIAIDEMVTNLLHWSSTQREGWALVATQVRLNLILAKCESLFKESAKGKNISIDNLIKTDTVVIGDVNQIELIFRNLINNAIKFTKEGGNITIDLHNSNEFVVVSISDTGVGMSEELLKTIQQTNNSISLDGTKGERGTGLGLLLCYEMAEQNGGRIEIRSEAGKGSTFSVYLKNGDT